MLLLKVTTSFYYLLVATPAVIQSWGTGAALPALTMTILAHDSLRYLALLSPLLVETSQ